MVLIKLGGRISAKKRFAQVVIMKIILATKTELRTRLT